MILSVIFLFNKWLMKILVLGRIKLCYSGWMNEWNNEWVVLGFLEEFLRERLVLNKVGMCGCNILWYMMLDCVRRYGMV